MKNFYALIDCPTQKKFALSFHNVRAKNCKKLYVRKLSICVERKESTIFISLLNISPKIDSRKSKRKDQWASRNISSADPRPIPTAGVGKTNRGHHKKEPKQSSLRRWRKDQTPEGISHPLSKQNTEPANDDRMLKLSHGQNCPPHSPEETYKRRVFSQFHFIHLCDGCSARDTRPKNFN